VPGFRFVSTAGPLDCDRVNRDRSFAPPRIGGCQACIDPYPPRNPRALTPGPEDEEAPMNASWRAPMFSAMARPFLLVASVARANPCPFGMTWLPISIGGDVRSRPGRLPRWLRRRRWWLARDHRRVRSQEAAASSTPAARCSFDPGGNSRELRPDRHFGPGRVRGTAPFTTRVLSRRSAMREVRSSSTSPVLLEGQWEAREDSALLRSRDDR